VFASLSDRQIYTVNIDGSGRTRLTNSADNSRPVWSPDGQRIVFARQTSQSDIPDIYLMNADGSNLVRRTVGAGYGSVAWSPDGQKLAVSTEGLYESSLWVIKVTDDGSAPVLIAADGRTPAWSPDGQKIAFIRVSGDDGYDALATVNADGTGTTQITANCA
jgi:TolB protein